MKATYKRLSSTYYHVARDTINHVCWFELAV